MGLWQATRRRVRRWRMRRRLGCGLLTVVVGLLAAIGGGGCAPDPGDSVADLRIMVPNPPGSGYDITARTVASALDDAGIAPGVEVFHLPGAGGLVGAQRMRYESGNGQLLMLMGQGLVGSQWTSSAPVRLQDLTAVARLIEEPCVLVVTPDSPYQNLADLIEQWRRDPAAVAAGGGSLPGGPDHLVPMLLAREIGIPAPAVTYQRYDGGGELLAAILDRRIAFGVAGPSEYADQIASGQLRVLAVTGPDRVPGIDAPSLREAGQDVVFTNWRGLVAPPDLTQAERQALFDAVARLRDTPQWRSALATNGWHDAYLAGPDFARFLDAEVTRLNTVMTELGLG
jgi:putative tricarboxylic transport membrane protein